MKIIHFQRKPFPAQFSIEQLFQGIRQQFPTKLEVSVQICPNYSRGITPRLQNMQFARKQKADIYHITGDVHYLALGLPPAQTMLTIHDLAFLEHPNALYRRFLKWFWLDLPLRRVQLVTTISGASRAAILKAAPFFPEDRIHVIPNTLPTQIQFRPKPFFTERPRILLIGTKPNKNLARALEAIKDIPCLVHIIGEHKPELQSLLHQYNIPYEWSQQLSMSAVLEAYQHCDLLLFPSTLEGFGLPILEAQATGRVVITSNHSSMPEVAGEGADLVDPFSVYSIRAGVQRVIKNAEYRQELIEAGRKNLQRFEAKEVAARYQALYELIYSQNH